MIWRTLLGHRAYPWVLLGLGLLTSLLIGVVVQHVVAERFAERFRFHGEEMRLALVKRMGEYELALRSGIGLFRASESVERQEWRAFVDALDLPESRPGIQGMGYSQIVTPAELTRHEAHLRAQGHAGYRVYPAGARDFYTAIVYLEPDDERNQRAIGYDMWSEPVRRQAMERARDYGEMAISGDVRLVQETGQDEQRGFLMFLPVYRNGAEIATVEQRRLALQGFVYSPFRVKDLLQGVFGRSVMNMDFALYEGIYPNNGHLLYASRAENLAPSGRAPSGLEHAMTVELGGQHWTLLTRSLPGVSSGFEEQLPLLLTLGGLAATLLLFLYVRALAAMQREAFALARKMTGELRSSEERARTLVEFAPDAILVIDEIGVILQCNPATERFFGYSVSELIGNDINMLMPEPDRSGHAGYLRRYLATGEKRVLGAGRDVQALRKDGSLVTVHLRVGEHFLPDGTRRFIGFVRDLSERIHTENELRERKTLLRNVIETSKDGFWVTDMQGAIIEVNDTYARLSGYSRDALLQMNIRDLEAQEPAAETAAHIERLMREGSDLFETRHRRSDGTQWDVEVSATYSAEQDGRLIVFCRDISDRKAAEQHLGYLVAARTAELRASEARYRGLVEQSPDGIFVANSEGRYVDVNRAGADMLGYSREEILACGIKALVCQEDASRIPHELARLDDQTTVISEWTFRRKDGSVFPGEVVARRLPDGRLQAILRDITLRKKAESELIAARNEAERLARLKSAFLANMSHEIRTPLNGVLGLARIVARENAGRQSGQMCEQILDAGHHLLGVINDVLDFSKIEAGKFLVDAKPFRLGSVIANAHSFVKGAAQQKSLSCRIALDPALPEWVVGDPQRIQQILVNLLSNAVKFTAQGEIGLQVKHTGEVFSFHITDSGIGMTQEQLGRLFQPFEQADSSTTRLYGGSGLGLAISRQLAQLMHGEIRAESAPGSGSVFTLTLPLAPGAPPDDSASATPDDEPHLNGLEILGVEDAPVNRIVLADILAQYGARFVLAENGQQAVDWVASDPGRFDVVLMDIQMPLMDGHAATRRIREIAPALPVIGLTAHALPEERAKCAASGMVDHVAKPIEPDLLVAAVLRHAPVPQRRVASAHAVAPAPSLSGSATLVRRPGELTDWVRLSASFGAKPGLIETLVRATLDSQRTLPQRLRDAAAQGNAAEVVRLAHGLRSVAGNLKADSIMAQAKALELMAQRESAELIEPAALIAVLVEAWLDELATRLASPTLLRPGSEGEPAHA